MKVDLGGEQSLDQLFQFQGRSFSGAVSRIRARARIRPGLMMKVLPIFRSGIPMGISVQPKVTASADIFCRDSSPSSKILRAVSVTGLAWTLIPCFL